MAWAMIPRVNAQPPLGPLPTHWRAFHHDLERAASDMAGVQVRLVTRLAWPFRYLTTALYGLLEALTWSRFDRQAHARSFAKTCGRTIKIPENFTLDQAWSVLPHEARHVWQIRRAGLGWIPLGMVVFGLAYVLAPLPVGLAAFRAWAELDAEAASWRYRLRTAPDAQWATVAAAIEKRAVAFASTVSGSAYGWSLPASWTRRWYLRRARAIIAAERRT